jgi:hypothetical protein
MSVALIVACLRRYRSHLDEAGPVKSLEHITIDAALAKRALSPEHKIESTLSNPVRSALRGIVREAGWQIFARGGIKEMHRVAAEVEQAMPENRTFAGAVLDKWWDQIGTQEGGTWLA